MFIEFISFENVELSLHYRKVIVKLRDLVGGYCQRIFEIPNKLKHL